MKVITMKVNLHKGEITVRFSNGVSLCSIFDEFTKEGLERMIDNRDREDIYWQLLKEELWKTFTDDFSQASKVFSCIC